MTAPRECRPPENTPDGTVCWLRLLHEDGRTTIRYEAWEWDWMGAWWGFGDPAACAPGELHAAGWRFHSIAEPPHE